MSRPPVGILLLSATAFLFAAGCGGVDTAQFLGLESLSKLAQQPTADELPASQDRDGDGLSDEEEDELGTHRADPDTDGDGFDDFAELITATDPLRANRTETVDGVPPAFDGLIQPGTSQVFFRGSGASFIAYLRLMGLVRGATQVRIVWRELDRKETVAEATTTVTFEPNAHWCWGHDLGGSAVVVDPVPMTVNQLEVTVLSGDSVAFSMISSGGLANGPRGLVPFPADIAEADLNLTLLMAHGLGDTAATWDSFAFLAERISDDIRIIRTDVDPLGPVAKRAGALARFILREEPERVYAIGHSMGGMLLYAYELVHGAREIASATTL
ncbi:MAG: alpha/beta fold hydrolase, partial [Planctomycetes bacterium]|nr:alpha/beta fold hydrolase [Planctomycetota bacterium]